MAIATKSIGKIREANTFCYTKKRYYAIITLGYFSPDNHYRDNRFLFYFYTIEHEMHTTIGCAIYENVKIIENISCCHRRADCINTLYNGTYTREFHANYYITIL